MINDHTVLVLGAGSSAQYGFPSGVQLKEWMVSQTQIDGAWSKPLKDISTSEEHIEQYRRAIIASPDDSIDAVLTRRPGLGSLGRFMIARRIAQCEQENNIFPPRGWYRDLFHMLHLDDASKNPPSLTVVTFNYDRSFEYYFWRTIDSVLEGKGQETAQYKMKNIRIIHVHGSLGDIRDVPFGLGGDLVGVEKIFENIRVVSDSSLDNSTDYFKAQETMQLAQRIVFIGFGFDPTNVRRLRLDNLVGKVPIMASSYKLSRLDALREQYGDGITFFNIKADGMIKEIQKVIEKKKPFAVQ